MHKALTVSVIAGGTTVFHDNRIDGADGLGQGVDGVQTVHDADLVGYGDVVAGEIHFRDAGRNRWQVFRRHLDGQVEVIQTEGLKRLVVHGRREAVPQGVAQKSDQFRVDIHYGHNCFPFFQETLAIHCPAVITRVGFLAAPSFRMTK